MLEPWYVEEIAPGVTRQWSAKRDVVIFRLMNFRHPAIDAWANSIQETITEAQRPRLLVYYFSILPSILTIHYLQQKFRQIDATAMEIFEAAETPPEHTYIAVVPPRQFAPLANFIIARQALLRRNFGLTVHAFGTLDEALEWLVSREAAGDIAQLRER